MSAPERPTIIENNQQNLRAQAFRYFQSPEFQVYKPKTQEFYTQGINHFLQFASRSNLQDPTQITRDSIQKYVEANNKTTTIYRRIAAISGFLIWTLQLSPKDYQKNPFSQIMINRKNRLNEVIFPKYRIRNF